MERYEIIVQDKRKKQKTNVAGEDEKKKSNVAGEEEDKEEAKEKQERIATGKIIAKTVVNAVKQQIVPRIGELTRDSLLQRKIDDTMSLIDTGISFAIHPVYGLMNYMTKTASHLATYTIQLEKEHNRLAVSLQRAGYVNRSRE